MSIESKIVNLEEIESRLKAAREQSQTVGFVEGVFDVLHLGHVELMEFAKKYCDVLVVGVASDAYVKSTKGPDRPIFEQMIRCKVLAALSATDFILKEDNPPAILESKEAEIYLHKVTMTIKPDVIIASGVTDRNPEAKKARADEVGAKFIVEEDPRPDKNSSTTKILSLLK